MTDISTCPKCGGEMENGFAADTINHHGYISQSYWIPGNPEFYTFLGYKMGRRVKSGPTQFPIISNCCKNCGYLESYVDRNKVK